MALQFNLDTVPKGLRTRFAPSPTGLLHLGHVVSALFVYAIADAIEGDCLLRLEDHDQSRCRPEYEQAIIDDLSWLGLVNQQSQLVRQSDRFPQYQTYFDGIQEHCFACQCSRSDIVRSLANRQAGQELRYPGTCRQLGHKQGGWRLRLEDQGIGFFDQFLGQVHQNPHHQCGDLLIRDRNGHWTYQFAVAIDDWLDDIEFIIRGQDLTSSTARQIQLRSMFTAKKIDYYLHHPLLLAEDGRKLSKRDGAQGIATLRQQGFSGDEVLGMAAYHSGLQSHKSKISRPQIRRLLDV